ncbi:hypothetical protein ACFL3V_05740 [Nanoarchaeota archaeon]
MKSKRGYASYFTILGLVLMLFVLINMFVSDIYPEHRRCEVISDSLHSMVTVGVGVTGDVSATVAAADSQETVLLLIQRCDTVANDVLISYGLMSLGIAFFVGGLITIRETR